MIYSIYTGITIALATALLVLGLLFYSMSRSVEAPVFRTALRIMVITYCFFGLVNLLELCSRTFMPDADDMLLFQTVTLVVAVSQAFLFTYTLILLIHAAYVTRKRIIRELVPIVILSIVLEMAYFTLPAAWAEIAVYLFTLFYIYLLIKYTRLFVITRRDCLRKMDNFFSGQEAEHLNWVKFSFYAALSIGALALIASLFPAILVGIVCSIVYLLFYLYFAFQLINHGFVYKRLEEALSENDDIPAIEQEDDQNVLLPSIAKPFEAALKAWLDEKRFLQSGITIEEVASQIGTNRSYLSEHINSGTGKNFRQWMNELRIEEAQKLLRQNPEMSVNEIAFAVGFVNNSHFGRQFRLFTATTPNEWRKNKN